MKVLVINGSPRKDGNCERLLQEAINVLKENEVEVEFYELGTKDIRGCMACGYCYEHGHCVFNDDAVKLNEILKDADGLLVASPVYYGSANGSLISLLDRMFYSANFDLRMKVGAAFAVARRAGTVATFDEINRYFTISQMPVASGRYWNNGFGRAKEEVEKDEEGLQNARIVARNMVFLMRSISLGKEKYGLPEMEKVTPTHFIK